MGNGNRFSTLGSALAQFVFYLCQPLFNSQLNGPIQSREYLRDRNSEDSLVAKCRQEIGDRFGALVAGNWNP